MNFFRRNSTTIPTPSELEAATTKLPKIRLRGSVFFYTPRPLTNKTHGKSTALCYRGNTYERELPTPPVKKNGTTTTLAYWGITYDCPSDRLRQRQLPSPAVETAGKTVTLIYRGLTYERKLQHPQPYQQPHTINWRWQ